MQKLRQNNPTLSLHSVQALVIRGTEEVVPEKSENEKTGNETDKPVRYLHDIRLRATPHLRMTEEHVVSFLEKIACPTLFILANQGGLKQLQEHYSSRKHLFRSLETISVEGHHHIHLDSPHLISNQIIQFLH